MRNLLSRDTSDESQSAQGMDIGRRRVKGRIIAKSPHRVRLFLGVLLVLGFVILAVFADFVSPYSPEYQDTADALSGPSVGHLLGTDELGRDIFSRVVFGARVDLTIAITSILAAYLLALPFGLSAGYFGGKVDTTISSVSDSILTFPTLVLGILLVTVLGGGITGLVLVIAATKAPQLIRYIRGFVTEIRNLEYIEAARAMGASHRRVLMVEVFRNIAGPSMVVASLMASQALLIASALGFLGLGVQPPTPEWGTMLSRGRDYYAQAPHMMLFPGSAIATLILGFNLIGDSLRDLLDVKT